MHPTTVALVVDLLAVMLLVLGLVQGLRHGLTGELVRLLNVLVSALLGIVFCDSWAPYVSGAAPGRWAWILAFVSIAVVSFVVLTSIRYVISRMFHLTFDQNLARVTGGVAGLAFWLVMVVLVFLLLNMVPSPRIRELFGKRSLVGQAILRELPKLHPNVGRMLSGEAFGRGEGGAGGI